MSKWFFINFAVLLFSVWEISTGNSGIHILFATIGLLLILYNWTRHAVYSTIRSNIPRERKIKFANLTKKVRKYHQYVGTTALIIILIHGIIASHYYQFHHTKVLSGLLAVVMLAGVVMTGWMRKWKKSRKRHTIHLIFGYGLFTFVILHILL